jgi:hypothetical protein
VTKFQTISTTRKKYELTINMPVNDQNVRLYFGIGRFSGKFYIDNISLTQIEPSTGNQVISLNESSFSIYPNPSKGNFTVKVSGFSEQKEQNLEILSLDGKLLYQTKLLKLETKINPGRLNPGLYLVNVKSEDYSYTSKLIIN